MNLQWLILKQKVENLDRQIAELPANTFSKRIVPNWLPPEYGKERIKFVIPIDYLNDESIKDFAQELRRLVGLRNQFRAEQAKLALDLDMTKIEETVPT